MPALGNDVPEAAYPPEDHLTDDTTATNTGRELSADHQAAIFLTQHQGMTAASPKDHHNQIRHIMNWLGVKYPDVCDPSTVVVCIETHADPLCIILMVMSMI